MSQDLLSSLLDDIHDVEMMLRTLDMTSLDHLNHLLEGIERIEELMMRPNHHNNIFNQIPKLLLDVGKDYIDLLVG